MTDLIFASSFTVPESVIDENGHVNNVAYVQWMQDVVCSMKAAVFYNCGDVSQNL